MHTSGRRCPRRPRLGRPPHGTASRPTATASSSSPPSPPPSPGYWPDVRSNAVDPGWVPTRMGGPHATDDLDLGHDTQVWLATSDEPAANPTGRYWYHRTTQPSSPMVQDHDFQESLVDTFGRIAGESLIR